MNNVRCVWVLPFVVASICFASASSAFAQGGTTGTLTGTVVDSSGSAVPGATVTATEAATAAVRTVVSNENGLFRIAGLESGTIYRQGRAHEFQADDHRLTIALSSAEIRDLGKVTLQVGALTETVSVTSEVTPVQVADSARRKTVTGDDLQNIQMKGRDIYNLLAVLPGVQDTNLNRDFSSWTSATQITINGAPSQNKDVRVDGINIVDEGGCGTAFVNLNMDAVGRSPGDLERLHGRERTQQRRHDQRRHQVGHEHLQGLGLVQRPPRQVQRERLLPQGQQPAEAALRRQHLRIRLRRTARHPGRHRLPARRRATRPSSSCRRSTPSTSGRPRRCGTNLPTALERVGDFSQTRADERHDPADHRSEDRRSSSPATSFRRIASARWDRRC